MASYPVYTPRNQGTFAYAAGTATGTVDVPAGARLHQVYVIAAAGGAATVTIAGGATITVPASTVFSVTVNCDAKNQDVVIGGTNPGGYYVSWYTGA